MSLRCSFALLSITVWFAVITPAKGIAAPADPYAQARPLFRQAWKAAGRGDWQQVVRLEQQLGDYPLVPYLRAEQLSRSPDLLNPEQMAEYLHRYSDWSFHRRLQRQWLRHLGENQQHDALLRYGAASDDTRVRCHMVQARINQGAGDELIPVVQKLWTNGDSLPRACDGSFRWLEKHQGIDATLAWKRAELALEQGNLNLARYLKRFLDSQEQVWLQRWIELARRPTQNLKSSLRWPDSPLGRRMLTWAMVRLAQDEVDDAAEMWPGLQARFDFSSEQEGRIEREIALFRAVRLRDDAVARIDALPKALRDDQMLGWRARVSMSRGDWQGVADSIMAMGRASSGEDRWRYWLARSLDELGLASPTDLYKELAQQANYHGFLAADRLQQPYAICPADGTPDPEWIARVAAQPAIQRALELYRVGLEYHARLTWRQATRGVAPVAAVAASSLAREAGWTDQAIFTLANASTTHHYDWRFPRLYQDTIVDNARLRGLDPALIYGIIRAESALRSDAVSAVGARGLMQLMPATAQQVAKRQGLPYPGHGALLNPEHNVRLGTAYFAELLQRFTHSPMLAAGAYNAGPNIVERWLRERPPVGDPDIWPETIPYHETRDYIPNVFAYSVIYEWLMNGRVTPLSERLRLATAGPGQALPPPLSPTSTFDNAKEVACPLSQPSSDGVATAP